MSEDERETNRAHWDALAAVHGQDDYYDAEALVGGADSLGAHKARMPRRSARSPGATCCTSNATSASTRSRWRAAARP